MGNIHQIICHARHDLAGLVVVVVAVGELFEETEHIGAHLSLHSDAHDMTVVLNKVVKQHPDDVYAEQSDAEDNNQSVLAVRDQVVEHTPGDHRVDNAYQRYKKRSAHIGGKKQFIWFII